MNTPRQSELPFTEIERPLEPEGEDHPGQFQTAAAAWRYMLGGNATITLRSRASGTRFTYRLRQKQAEDGERGDPITFVALLSGADNESSYQYLGHFFATSCNYQHGRKSAISAEAPSARAFAWAWENLKRGVIPEQLEVWHEGRCGKCGRKLTVPESIASGFGPECARHV